ncbi:MAG: LysR family transcriptional regulator [Myxococcales bacterium]
MTQPVISAEDLRLLAAFADDTNLRRAASELGLARSTLSRRLAELEERLGQSLFLRHGRTLAITSFGERLVAHAKTARDALGALERAAGEAGRSFAVAVSPLFADVVLPDVLAAMAERHPTTRVQVLLSHAYSDLFDDRVDVALRRGPLEDSTSLNARRLGRLSMICVARSAPLLERAMAADDRARALPWIRVGSTLEPFVLPLHSKLTAPRVTVSPRYAVDSQRLALDLVLRGLGVARLNAFLARPRIASGELVEVLPEARATEAVFAVYARRARPDAQVRDFVAAVVARCHELDIWDNE